MEIQVGAKKPWEHPTKTEHIRRFEMSSREEIEKIIGDNSILEYASYKGNVKKTMSEQSFKELHDYFLNDSNPYQISYRKVAEYNFYDEIIRKLMDVIPHRVIDLLL